jgi:hypothetical protein
MEEEVSDYHKYVGTQQTPQKPFAAATDNQDKI